MKHLFITFLAFVATWVAVLLILLSMPFLIVMCFFMAQEAYLDAFLGQSDYMQDDVIWSDLSPWAENQKL